ncbi:NAD(P)-dependent dehydrogenase (short-subunit alcohol dehydrogenase family) [Paenibacillus sp. V4I3]|uniref:SDR family NAD(P)-dependent oxidoreductase n=1 Tax=unclassified Paenibacillus TaxID=185978 RepID=UPI002783C394|nr:MULTISPECIES: glucose 1-dehydrogenase [unclassified Paenibacillus]MDQ0876154.1 NAD(P)-dependent dehydrogenase (short-subunit alcohol dehydrogenase family) [Paenibacillus sp. V4I3]MDQ0887808.1 NAD(P)-dependent dehydrogenase (short-subunit alcohol dehydrogenase family) [Paenibacillus sp. V4I9]
MGKLYGKVALITGGSSGIGLATAKLFVAEGAKVVITGRNQVALNAAVEELGTTNALVVQADAADPTSADKAVAAAVEKFGRLDVVFANAGISGNTPLGGTEFSVFEEILKINVTGTFFTVQAALPHLKAGASVILNGSVLAKAGSPGWSAYAASKGAVTSMARVLVSELSPRGIRVNTIVPGATRTPIWGQPEGLAQFESVLTRAVPLNRLGEPEEIANVALFLASDDSSFVQGAEISVDGGAGSSPFGAPIYRQK